MERKFSEIYSISSSNCGPNKTLAKIERYKGSLVKMFRKITFDIKRCYGTLTNYQKILQNMSIHDCHNAVVTDGLDVSVKVLQSIFVGDN